MRRNTQGVAHLLAKLEIPILANTATRQPTFVAHYNACLASMLKQKRAAQILAIATLAKLAVQDIGARLAPADRAANAPLAVAD